MKLFKSEKGEFTVEATIVFTFTFITLIIMFYIGIIMYQQVHFQSTTDRISSRGAMMYATRGTNMKNATKKLASFKNNDPYRYIYDGEYRGKAKKAIEKELSEQIGTGNLLSRNSRDFEKVEISLGLFTRKVVLTGKRGFDVPFISAFSLDKSMFDLDVTSVSYIMDMPEIIRNVDYATDLLKRSEKISGAIDKVSGLKDKLNGFIGKIGSN